MRAPKLIVGYLWWVSCLDCRNWTEINVLTSNLICLGGRIWIETLCHPQILLSLSISAVIFSLIHTSTFSPSYEIAIKHCFAHELDKFMKTRIPRREKVYVGIMKLDKSVVRNCGWLKNVYIWWTRQSILWPINKLIKQEHLVYPLSFNS